MLVDLFELYDDARTCELQIFSVIILYVLHILCILYAYELFHIQLPFWQTFGSIKYMYVYVNGSNINFSDPVFSHLFSIFVRYFVNVLWKMAHRSDIAQECHVLFFMASTYDL